MSDQSQNLPAAPAPASPPARKLTPLDAAMRPILASSPNIVKLLPPGMAIDRFLMQVRVALNRNPDLQACSPSSLIGAVLEAADLGLDPSGRLGSAYLVPFKGQVTLVPGYRGLIDLAARSGLVRSINAWAVFEKDHWENRAGYTPRHIPYEPKASEPQDPGEWYLVWARARLAGGVTESEVMRRREVEAVKARSPGARSPKSPWNGSPEDQIEMAKKTVLRRLLKKSPLSPTPQWEKLSRALDIGEGAVIEGEARQIISTFDYDPTTGEVSEGDPSPQSAVEDLKKKL